jgi:hypothetical protein
LEKVGSLYCKYFRNINYNRGITNGKCINSREREFYCRPRRIRQFEDGGKMVQSVLILGEG